MINQLRFNHGLWLSCWSSQWFQSVYSQRELQTHASKSLIGIWDYIVWFGATFDACKANTPKAMWRGGILKRFIATWARRNPSTAGELVLIPQFSCIPDEVARKVTCDDTHSCVHACLSEDISSCDHMVGQFVSPAVLLALMGRYNIRVPTCSKLIPTGRKPFNSNS